MSHQKESIASIRWFGLVPSGWVTYRLKQVTISVTSGVSVNASDAGAEPHQFGVLKTSAVCGGKFFPEENKTVWESEADRLACPVTRNSLIMSRMNTPSLVGESGYVAQDFPTLFLPDRLWKLVFDNETVFTPYISHVLSSSGARQALSCMATGTSPSMKNLSIEEMGNLPVPLPALDEQKLIATYLDRETARIDRLIAAKERMLALLEEKRAALVSRVVTRGLDPQAPLKPSGQEWLGEIPAHWQVLRLKFATSGIDQGASPQCYSYPAAPGEWGVLKTGCVNGGEFREQENKALPDENESLPEIEVHQGDVLMSRASGSVDLIGSVAHVASQPVARLMLSDKIYRLRVRGDILNPRYLVLAMGARYLRHQIKSVISGAEGLANNIAKSDVMELLLLVPPILEQRRIVDDLDRAISSNKVLCGSLGKSIALAKERRAALITAAVTGQLPLEVMTR